MVNKIEMCNSGGMFIDFFDDGSREESYLSYDDAHPQANFLFAVAVTFDDGVLPEFICFEPASMIGDCSSI